MPDTYPRMVMPAGAALRALLAASLLCVLPAVADAQNAPTELRQRMDAFARALREREPMARIASFFPRDSAWELVDTPDRKAPGAALRRRRFEPGSTLRAISEGGPVCNSFGGVIGDMGPSENALVMQAMESPRPWRYVGRGRFVPTGARAGSPNFVEWRRERGTWVVSRVGESYDYSPRVIGREPPDPTRDITAGNGLPLERRLAADTRWYQNNEPIVVAYRRWVKYGLPRLQDDSLLVRYGSLGVVPVFARRGYRERPDLLYVPVAPGEYQPYETHGHSVCRA